jgi:RHS repeat-associated protein
LNYKQQSHCDVCLTLKKVDSQQSQPKSRNDKSMAINGAPAGSKLDANAKYSAYVSPYYVENGSGTKSGAFSKHYYAGSDRIASKTADDAYFYFTDHLGSTTHITDRSGDVAQYAAYTPYGSLFREYRSVQPYKFNGKELDQETGYYYYGARYYDPSIAIWLGTDPLKHKYPDIGAYVYCAGNPVNRIDPDGRADFWLNGKVVGNDGVNDQKIYAIKTTEKDFN